VDQTHLLCLALALIRVVITQLAVRRISNFKCRWSQIEMEDLPEQDAPSIDKWRWIAVVLFLIPKEE